MEFAELDCDGSESVVTRGHFHRMSSSRRVISSPSRRRGDDGLVGVPSLRLPALPRDVHQPRTRPMDPRAGVSKVPPSTRSRIHADHRKRGTGRRSSSPRERARALRGRACADRPEAGTLPWVPDPEARAHTPEPGG
ncbi:hypothetical protein HLASF_0872 [Halanaeroarchaeum sulfurireducens]|uniref:Uncharacterized protein n=1 Tax=Halanaeroarchaeum sulfurireducens TaxID=1604004 RepID=A0A0F7PB38_9EURY|nr:hypothetical protein HLASF_0872 [Halanaeroarchaeum sulfurireducens]ALG81767.1 hypothetical protein HLASA_0869 [Halanaeroarchaeum sulfurireducens]